MPTTYDSLRVERGAATLELTLDRPKHHNALDRGLIEQLHAALDLAEADAQCRLVLLQGLPGTFCTGMDLAEAAAGGGGDGDAFFDLLHRFTTSRRMIAAVVDGQASGGGVGLAAASDLVLATPRSTFTLPEALWGLLPCIILPFLARRMGWHQATLMTLTTQPVPAAAAHRVRLVDEIADDPVRGVRRLAFRLSKLDEGMTAEAKRYARAAEMAFDGAAFDDGAEPHAAKRLAVGELSRLMAEPRVRARMSAYVDLGRLPWETE